MVFRPVELYTSAALAYLAVGLLLTAGAMWVERRYGAERIERLARREAASPRPIRTAPQDL
jgi:hypothetical protein